MSRIADAPTRAVPWRPSASRATLELRAELLARTRSFFAGRGVLEVETPQLCAATVPDVHLHSVGVRLAAFDRPLFLQTSPELAMKRLLAAGSGPIYQIARAFRDGEIGRRHNPEFTLVEWYRPGLDDHRLMDEVEALLTDLLPAALRAQPAQRWRYRELFRDRLDVDPLGDPLQRLREVAGPTAPPGLERDDLLAFLLTHRIEPGFPHDRLLFVHDFPASQAALARLAPDAEGDQVGRRFEVWAGGLELANGYWELGDPVEQRARFERDLRERKNRGLDAVPIDERLLAALETGFPDCAGVALGFDRVVMLAAGAQHIGEVLAFSIDHA
ncbi:MAG TPA: EF-P lysine aminoacylase EpmA [Thermoanaerobaculia bacterium]|nr:EF-P lysine aminoacylase EpmA [Thermoanaerobaculia bacterium]